MLKPLVEKPNFKEGEFQNIIEDFDFDSDSGGIVPEFGNARPCK